LAKDSGAFLLLLVHSDLYFAFPEVILPIEWFLLSSFFFISGFLAFDSFHKRGASIKEFFKSKIVSLYVPFVVAVLGYFALQIVIGMMKADPVRLLSQVFMLNIFDALNSGTYNWSFLFFIPYLLSFMLVFCLLEKYVKSAKIQFLIVLSVWFCTVLSWVYELPMKLGMVFTQYFLVFMTGFWLNKLKLYDKIIKFRTALIAAPLIVLFSFDFTYMFSFNTTTETLKHLLYTNGRSIALTLAAIVLLLVLQNKSKISNHFIEVIAKASIFIYLTEPFISFMLRNYVFGENRIYFATGIDFYSYQIIRVAILFVLLPFVIQRIEKYRKRKAVESG